MYDTFAEAHRALEQEETSCEALVSSFLDRIDAVNGQLNIFTQVDPEGARAAARAVDDARARGTRRPLDGMVMAVKEVIAMEGHRLTCGSHMLEDFTSLFDATAVARLQEAGAVVIGRVNCDEFAMGSSNENSHFGPVRNPVHPDYVPGGSSGGSAAAVAAGLCHVALGTDTGGSVRQPAAFCGVVGLKPTYGRVSRYGLVAFASSFDCIGPLGRTVEDVAAVMAVMAGRDPSDATSAPVPVDDYATGLGDSVRGLRVGLPREYYGDGLDEALRARIDEVARRLEAEGAEVRDVSLPHTEYGVAAYYILATAEASSNLSRYDGIRYGHRAGREAAREVALADGLGALEALYTQSRSEGFGEEVQRRIMLGTYVLSSGYYDAYYGKAQRVRTLIRQDFDRALEEVDVLLTPATPTPPFKLGERVEDPLAMYLGDVYTVTANLAGIPGLVVPVGRQAAEPQLPLGAQLLGRPFEEATLLRAGKAIEQAFADTTSS